MSATLNENPKRGRLWIEDQIISGAKLEETLEEFGISMGQVVYVEYSNNSNQWPTDNTLGKPRHLGNTSSTNLGGMDEAQKTNGLYNLGNSKLRLRNYHVCVFVYSLLHEFGFAVSGEYEIFQ
jgi:hypothetical protein